MSITFSKGVNIDISVSSASKCFVKNGAINTDLNLTKNTLNGNER